MAGTSDRDRFYSRPPSPHGISSMYGWAPDATSTGMPGLTGLWTPISVNPSGYLDVTLSNVTLSGNVNVDSTETNRLLSGISGELQTPLNRNIDSVVAWQSGATTVSSTSTSGINPSGTNLITGVALAANPNRIAWFAQNVSVVGPAYLKLGNGLVNENNCNIILNPANEYNQGGGSYSDQGTWRGSVSVSGRGKLIIWEV